MNKRRNLQSDPHQAPNTKGKERQIQQSSLKMSKQCWQLFPRKMGTLLAKFKLVLLLVALWFILRGDLFCVFPCVILFLCFSVLLVLRLPRLGKRELILVLFVRLFGLCLFRFVGFLFLLGSGKGCGLWLWHSLDFSLTFFFFFFFFVFFLF